MSRITGPLVGLNEPHCDRRDSVEGTCICRIGVIVPSALGRLAIIDGEHEEAAKHLTAAVECPGMQTGAGCAALARANLALLLCLGDQPQKALEHAEAAAEAAECRARPFLVADARGLLGLILIRLGREAEGRAALETALSRGALLYRTPLRQRRSAAWRQALDHGSGDPGRDLLPLASGLY